MTARDRRDEVWARVASLRIALADRVDALDDDQLSVPSWCEGWQVRDVIGHLVHLAEATQLTMARDIATNGILPNRAIARLARRTGAAPPEELARRLRAAAGGRFHVVGTPPAVALGELLVHGEDALAPLGQSLASTPADAVTVLDLYRRIGGVVFRTKLPRDVRLVAEDGDWSAGRGPEVRGRALDVLLLLANRSQARQRVHGDGVAALR